ncbi:hypothetical protein [Haloarcula nitratireducens]|uniref:Uncharacterized protein n=1 Tax=Haloarcula nitratireducens TaxID=2487749 RepID=A0AAW4PCW9_9EURY|nr:hypothetical protein [Halomicroarcula nitratireducens]MBX0295438.1 hypothetical protein [Halomicroarcula nitratireducens]
MVQAKIRYSAAGGIVLIAVLIGVLADVISPNEGLAIGLLIGFVGIVFSQMLNLMVVGISEWRLRTIGGAVIGLVAAIGLPAIILAILGLLNLEPGNTLGRTYFVTIVSSGVSSIISLDNNM